MNKRPTIPPILSRLVRAECASCSCGIKTHEQIYHAESCLYRTLRDAVAYVQDSEFTLEIRWEADMRAIKRWQEANPGNGLTWPDHADLVVWLLDQLATKEGK